MTWVRIGFNGAVALILYPLLYSDFFFELFDTFFFNSTNSDPRLELRYLCVNFSFTDDTVNISKILGLVLIILCRSVNVVWQVEMCKYARFHIAYN